MLGYIPRELAQYLSPLIEKFCLNFEVKELYCMDYILQITLYFSLSGVIFSRALSDDHMQTYDILEIVSLLFLIHMNIYRAVSFLYLRMPELLFRFRLSAKMWNYVTKYTVIACKNISLYGNMLYV